MIPVWPVARKSASTPRALEARGRSPARYISCRARNRCRPSAAACRCACGRWRSGCRPAACARRSAAGRAAPRPPRSSGMSLEPACMPLTMSSPASSASTRAGTQCRAITPPALATPITSERAPRRRGLGRRQRGQAGGDASRRAARYSPTHLSARPVAQAEGGLGIAGLGRVAEEQQIGRRQVERRTPRAVARLRVDVARTSERAASAQPRLGSEFGPDDQPDRARADRRRASATGRSCRRAPAAPRSGSRPR